MICQPESMRIGGEFEFSLDILKGRHNGGLEPSATSTHSLWVDTGRAALLIAAKAILHRGGTPRIWIPAYSCESVSQPFSQAGFDIKYYSVGTDLMAYERHLPQQAQTGDAVLLIHYFGHRNQRLLSLIQQYRSAGIWVIEDYVQASLAEEIRPSADFSVTSYRKVLPVPDGAELLSRNPVDLDAMGIKLTEPDEAFVSAKLVGKIMRGSGAAAEDFLPLLNHAEQHLQKHIVPRNISWLSRWMMPQLDIAAAASRRRSNWLALSDMLNKADYADQIQPIFATLDAADVPLGMPVRVGARRDDLKRFLAQHEIYCPLHWPLGHLPNDGAFAQERALASSLLTLPIDQRMSLQHVERMTDSITRFFRD